MNQICNTCKIEIDENIHLKDRTVCKSCYNKNRRKINNKQNQQPKVDEINKSIDNNPSVSLYENHAFVVIGPRNVGKTYYVLKILEKIGNKRPVHTLTRSLNQYFSYKTTTENKQ